MTVGLPGDPLGERNQPRRREPQHSGRGHSPVKAGGRKVPSPFKGQEDRPVTGMEYGGSDSSLRAWGTLTGLVGNKTQ